jgi:hypothetical protein
MTAFECHWLGGRLATSGGFTEGIEAFCERTVNGCGVLLLPGTVYDHGPSSAKGHFRIGLGRRDLPQCLEVLRTFLMKSPQTKEPQQG